MAPTKEQFKVDSKTAEQIEIEVLKKKIESLELQMQWLTSNWVGWKTSTQNMGQKIMIALEQIVEGKK